MPVHRLFFPLCLSHTVALGNAALQKSKKRKASNLMSVTPRFSATSCSPRALSVRSSLLPGRLYPTAIILSTKKFTVRLLSTIFIGYVRAGVVPLLFFYFSHPFPSVCLFELANREIKPRNEEARFADKLSVAGVWISSSFRTKNLYFIPLFIIFHMSNYVYKFRIRLSLPVIAKLSRNARDYTDKVVREEQSLRSKGLVAIVEKRKEARKSIRTLKALHFRCKM